MTNLKDTLKQFDAKFKCIQEDCAGGGHTYPTEEEPEGGQCQFCAEYLFPIKDFLAQAIKEALEGVVPEKKQPNYQTGGNYKEDECFNACRDQVKANITNFLEGEV